MATFSDEVCKHPVLFSKFEVLDFDGNKFRSTQAATEEHGKDGMIAEVSQLLSRMYSEQLLSLLNG
jgi:hypothetical protein